MTWWPYPTPYEMSRWSKALRPSSQQSRITVVKIFHRLPPHGKCSRLRNRRHLPLGWPVFPHLQTSYLNKCLNIWTLFTLIVNQKLLKLFHVFIRFCTKTWPCVYMLNQCLILSRGCMTRCRWRKFWHLTKWTSNGETSHWTMSQNPHPPHSCAPRELITFRGFWFPNLWLCRLFLDTVTVLIRNLIFFLIIIFVKLDCT